MKIRRTGLWIAGGTQGRPASALDRRHTKLYTAGLLLWLDVRSGRLETVVKDVSTAGQGSCFKGVSRHPDGLLLCHDAELVTVAQDRVVHRRTHSLYRDVHHALESKGRRWVASTGRHRVLEDGVPRGQGRHPNHLFRVGDEVFVTWGMDGVAASLRGPARWRLADVVVHDGVVQPDGVWFTAVDGRLLRVDPRRGVVDREVDLTRKALREAPLGWCRGLGFVDGLAWVGFTQLRATRARQNLAWLRGQLRGRQVATLHPTRLVAYDLDRECAVAEIDLASQGLDAIFGVLPSR